jgi:hypothetical protein
VNIYYYYYCFVVVVVVVVTVVSGDSSLGIATGCGLDNRGSIPNRGKIFLFSIDSRPALGPTSLLSKGYWGRFPAG